MRRAISTTIAIIWLLCAAACMFFAFNPEFREPLFMSCYETKEQAMPWVKEACR